MTIAILCGYPNSTYARDVLRTLGSHGIRGVHVVAADAPASPKTLQALWARHGWALPMAVARWVVARSAAAVSMRRSKAAPAASLKREVLEQGGRFRVVPDLNGEACRQALHAIGVDLLLLAGAPIIKAGVLSIPRIGTCNAHQGALPRFRGVQVIEWAVLEGYPPTVSVHFVDPGVDTGDILWTEPIPIIAGDRFADLRRRASGIQCELLARAAATALEGMVPRIPQRGEDGRQYYAMHPRLRIWAEERLARLAVSGATEAGAAARMDRNGCGGRAGEARARKE